MINYYKILNLKVNVGENDVYRSFKKRLKSKTDNYGDVRSLFKAYKVLSGPSKKFYDLLLKQEQKGHSLNKKYIDFVRQTENKAERLAEYYLSRPEAIESALYGSKFRHFFFESIVGIFGLDWSTYTSFGAPVFIGGLMLTAYSSYSHIYPLLVLGIALITSGILLMKRGATNIERERFNEITTPNKA